jgi:Trp operon repressor
LTTIQIKPEKPPAVPHVGLLMLHNPPKRRVQSIRAIKKRRNEMISVDTLYGIIEDGLNSKMGQVAIADKYGVGQTTVNRIFIS